MPDGQRKFQCFEPTGSGGGSILAAAFAQHHEQSASDNAKSAMISDWDFRLGKDK
jgi:hypothetical protein